MSDKLTRNELSWLLTQEARSAAQKLRVGVGMTDAGEEIAPPAPEEGSGGVERTLNQLDDAVNMLASLHGQPTHRGRRGKIDVAALVWEIAPEAKVQLEMGEGLTVFGDETELRRLLHVLMGQGGDPAARTNTGSEVSIKREGDSVRVSVHLGPDKSAQFDIERQFLSRMATRYGGRLVLEGATLSLLLPAEEDERRREVEDLKRELKAAQAQGEAYARELAAVYARDVGSSSSFPSSNPGAASQMPPSGDGLSVLVAAARSLTPALRGILASIGRDLAPLRDRDDEVGQVAASVQRHLAAASEVTADLTRLGACPLGELPSVVNLGELLERVVKEDAVRAARDEVAIEVNADSSADELVSAAAMTLAFQLLLEHAVDASPPGSRVSVSLVREEAAVRITFDDAGPAIPEAARTGLLSRDFEAISGRPTRFSLIGAAAVAANIGATLELLRVPEQARGVRVRLSVPAAPRGSSDESSE